MLDKLKFWKEEEPLNLDAELPPLDTSNPEIPSEMPPTENYKDQVLDPFQPPSFQQVQQPAQQPVFQQQPHDNRDMEIISAKLDAIKAELDSVNQRLRKIEKLAESDDEEKKPRDPWSKF